MGANPLSISIIIFKNRLCTTLCGNIICHTPMQSNLQPARPLRCSAAIGLHHACVRPYIHTRTDLSVSSQRRDVLTALLSAHMTLATAAAAAAAAADRDPTFYATWQYATTADILPFIQQQAAPGDAQAVLDAMDTFSQYYPQYKIGPEKGELFESVLQQLQPTWALEVGTFLGYSAIRTARHLQPGGQLLCIEANPQNAAVARQVVQYAGYGQQVTVIDGLSSQIIPKLPVLLATQQQVQHSKAGQQAEQLPQQQQLQQQVAMQQPPPQQPGFDFVFLDHCKECYLPDLQSLEQLGLVRRGTTVMADNVIYPGAPGYLEFLESSGRYKTSLLKARYEYEQAWNPDWEANKEDALSVSVCDSGALDGTSSSNVLL